MRKALILFSCILLTACGTFSLFPSKKKEKTQQISEVVTDNKEKTEVKKDSTSNKEISKAIKDKFDIQVGKTITSDEKFNKAVDKQVDLVLSNIDIRKESGDNSYHVYYDKKRRKIVVDVKIGETTNEKTNTTSSKSSEISNYESVREEFKKDVLKVATSWWTWLILAFVLRKWLARIVFFFVPSLRGIKTAKDLITPPSSNQ